MTRRTDMASGHAPPRNHSSASTLGSVAYPQLPAPAIGRQQQTSHYVLKKQGERNAS